MAESLLHASIVLSNSQYESIRAIHPMYTVPKNIGVITFLGVDNVNRDVVHLLIRFEPFARNDAFMIMGVIKRMFGKKHEPLLGNNLGIFSGHCPRVVITTKLQTPLRNPGQYIRKKAEVFAKEIVNWRLEHARMDREEADEHWQNVKEFYLPEGV